MERRRKEGRRVLTEGENQGRDFEINQRERDRELSGRLREWGSFGDGPGQA